MRIFCDIDGVLADLDTHYKNLFGIETSKALDNMDWGLVKDKGDFFAGIPMMPDAADLWEYIKVYQPIILTGVPQEVEEATKNKRDWVTKWFGANVEVRCVRSRDKFLSCYPGDILIDDWTKYRHRWLQAGGVWITHTSAQDSIKQLKEMEL